MAASESAIYRVLSLVHQAGRLTGKIHGENIDAEILDGVGKILMLLLEQEESVRDDSGKEIMAVPTRDIIKLFRGEEDHT